MGLCKVSNVTMCWVPCFTMNDMPSAGPFAEWLEGWQEWVDREDIVEGTPYLLSPEFEYDVELNAFFRSSLMEGRPQNTLEAYVRDMAGFFTFLWTARGGKGWRDADEDDHLAYRAWRVLGLRRAGATWGREVATVNVFYEWAVERGLVAVNPIPQRAARARPVQAGGSRRSRAEGTTPATGPHNARAGTLALESLGVAAREFTAMVPGGCPVESGGEVLAIWFRAVRAVRKGPGGDRRVAVDRRQQVRLGQ